MPIPEKINCFVGYGNTKPAVCFMGIEERLLFHNGMTEKASLERQIRARENFETTMDLQEAIQCRLGFNLWHGQANRPKLQKTYLGMIAIMLGILSPNDKRIFRDNDLQRLYQIERLGRTVGTTLLSELFPLPLKAHKQQNWPTIYTNEFGFDFTNYLNSHDIAQRRTLLQNLTAPVTICYGKSHWNEFKKLFDHIDWHQGHSIEFGANKQTFVVLTNHFTAHGSLYARLEEVINTILKNVPQIASCLISDRDWLNNALAKRPEK